MQLYGFTVFDIHSINTIRTARYVVRITVEFLSTI